MKIDSPQNVKIKQAVKLFDRRDRDKEGKFLIEGYREILRAAESGHPFLTLFYCPELFLQKNEKKLLAKMEKECTAYECSRKAFQRLSFRDRPDGLIAVAPKAQKTLEVIEKNFSKNPFIVIAESIEKPGNLGTILRSCDGAGVDGVIVCDRCTDIYNPNVVRASLGTLFTQPVVEATKQEIFAFLQKHGLKVIAASPDGKKRFSEEKLDLPLAVVVGSEQYGLHTDWYARCDAKVQIPMLGVADSLNVAQATTLLVYEVQRQRGYTFSG